MSKVDPEYDVVVIGGGPGGMMAAGIASKKGLKVLLLEKNEILGKKLLITGGGRCNVTNAELVPRAFLKHLGDSGKFLFSTFSQFGVGDTFDFFEGHGLKLKIEDRNRAFPIDDKSSSVLKVLSSQLGNVVVRTEVSVSGFLSDINTKEILAVKFFNGETINAKNFILATGGTSHPETGSTGDGYAWLKEIGHKVVLPEPSLVPIAIKDEWVKSLSGITLDEVKLTVIQNREKQFSRKGRILFTHFGISGPTVINMSKDVGESLKYGDVSILLDIFPKYDHGGMNTLLQEVFKNNQNKFFKNCMVDIVPRGLVETIITFSGIDPSTSVNSITREQRLTLIGVLKNLEMSVESLLGPEKSIVTSGGVDCTEVDFKTMSSKLYSNLYFVGDILNIERPSGGFSLQICWSTGFVAGSSCK